MSLLKVQNQLDSIQAQVDALKQIQDLSVRASADGTEYIVVNVSGVDYKMLASTFFATPTVEKGLSFTLSTANKNGRILITSNSVQMTIPTSLGWAKGDYCWIELGGTGFTMSTSGVTINSPATLDDTQYSIYFIVKTDTDVFTIAQLGVSGGGVGTVTSVAISGSDGIEVDSGSPITATGTIALGVNAADLRTHINVEDGAAADQTAAEVPSTPFSWIDSTNVQDALEEIVGNVIIESGFNDRVSSTISYDDATRTFTIDVALGYSEFTFWVDSEKYTKTTPQSVVWPDAEGLHYFYFDNTGTLVDTQTFSEDIITTYSFVAFVYWDATNSDVILFGDERHGREMDSATHVLLHRTSGTQYDTGLALNGITADGNGSSDTHAQLSVQDGLIRDEDIPLLIVDGSPQTLDPIAQIPVFYRSGASGVWRKIAATNFPVTTTGTGRAAWNEWTGATWQLTEVTNNDFVLMHIYATNDVENPIIAVMGQNEYGTTGAARTGAETEINEITFGILGDLLPEYVPIGTLIFQTSNTFTNTVKSAIISTDEGDTYIDWRFSDLTSTGGVNLSDHGNLSGLSDDDHPQYHNDTRGDARYYTQSQVDTLIAALGEFSDTLFRIQDNGDATKEIAFEASGITTGTTRTITMPDRNVDLTHAPIYFEQEISNAQLKSTTAVTLVSAAGAGTIIWPDEVFVRLNYGSVALSYNSANPPFIAHSSGAAIFELYYTDLQATSTKTYKLRQNVTGASPETSTEVLANTDLVWKVNIAPTGGTGSTVTVFGTYRIIIAP